MYLSKIYNAANKSLEDHCTNEDRSKEFLETLSCLDTDEKVVFCCCCYLETNSHNFFRSNEFVNVPTSIYSCWKRWLTSKLDNVQDQCVVRLKHIKTVSSIPWKRSAAKRMPIIFFLSLWNMYVNNRLI